MSLQYFHKLNHEGTTGIWLRQMRSRKWHMNSHIPFPGPLGTVKQHETGNLSLGLSD